MADSIEHDLSDDLTSPVRPRRIVRGPEQGDDYDALAALFLEDGALAATAAAERKAGASERHSHQSGQPIRPQAVSESVPERTSFPFPAPAAMSGRGESRGDTTSRQPPTATLTTEAVIVGHLPVLGAAWVGQYAKHAAAQLGAPVVLVRVSHDQTSVDLVVPPGQQIDAPAEPFETGRLDAALAAAAAVSAAWVVRVPETSEPELYDAGIDNATLLTGADEAAVVASYRTIKSLAGGAERDDGPQLRLAIMGASDESAAAAESRLRRATETFLGQRVPAAARIGRIAPARLISLYRGQETPEPADLINRIRRSRATMSAASAMAEMSLGNGRAETERTQTERVEPASPVMEPKPRMATKAEAAPVAAMPTPPTAAPTTARAATPVALPADAANAHRPLARFVPGVSVLELTCPYAPGVELACDTEGVLHLLAAAESAESALAVGQTVQRLLTAASWVSDHAQLLRRAFGALSTAGDPPETVLHLFTEEPRHARRLLDTGIRIHLLAHAVSGDGMVWVHREMN